MRCLLCLMYVVSVVTACVSSAINPVSALESALLLGYPLDLARSQQLADTCRRPEAVGTKCDR